MRLAVLGSSKEFNGFTSADFDAFEERKWTNNRFNLERMKVSDKLKALEYTGGSVVKQAAAIQLDLATTITLPHPNILNNNCVDEMWLAFGRGDAEKKKLTRFIEAEVPLSKRVGDHTPMYQYILTGLRIRHEGIRVGLHLHRHSWLDLNNLINKLATPWMATKFIKMLRDLPPRFQLLIDGVVNTLDSFSETGEDLKALLVGAASTIFLCATYLRDDEAITTTAFAATVAGDLELLLPVYQYIAWGTQNDFVSLKKKLKEEIKKKAPAAAKPVNKGDQVMITGGFFSGQRGVISEVQQKGKIKVLIRNIPIVVASKDVKIL